MSNFGRWRWQTFYFTNRITTSEKLYPKYTLNGNMSSLCQLRSAGEKNCFPFVDSVEGNKSACAYPPGYRLSVDKRLIHRYVASIYITCIMYSVWDISFSGLAVSPHTHGDQHIFWGCNNQKNAVVMWEQRKWHGIMMYPSLSCCHPS